MVMEDEDKPYVFPDRPAAKSSTHILVLGPGGMADNPACPSCGCRRDNLAKPSCGCSCHEGWNS